MLWILVVILNGTEIPVTTYETLEECKNAPIVQHVEAAWCEEAIYREAR